MKFTQLACPLDKLPLTKTEQGWRCPQGHSFDEARQGYIHLLPAQQKRSKDPGDSKAMVQARKQFLSQEFYAPIAKLVGENVQETVLKSVANSPVSILDAGCGEGYYLRQLDFMAQQCGIDARLVGLDISKWAVLAAAKSTRKVTWLVGSNVNIPIEDATLHCVLSLFGFACYQEFARVLKPGGKLLEVKAGPKHLQELRQIIYPEQKLKPTQSATGFDYLKPVNSQDLTYQIELGSQNLIAQLLLMTPHLYRANKDGLKTAHSLASLALTIDVQLIEYTTPTP